MLEFNNQLSKWGTSDEPGFDCCGYVVRLEFFRTLPWVALPGSQVKRTHDGLTAPPALAGNDKQIPVASLVLPLAEAEWPEDLAGYIVFAPVSALLWSNDSVFVPQESAVLIAGDRVNIDSNNVASPSYVEQKLDDTGNIRIFLPEDALIGEPFSLCIKNPIGEMVPIRHRDPETKAQVDETRHIFKNWEQLKGWRSPINVSVSDPVLLPKEEGPAKPKGLTGRVIAVNSSQHLVSSGLQVILWGFTKEEKRWAPVLWAVTDTGGYFSADYPAGIFTRALGVVPHFDSNPVPIKEEDSPGTVIHLDANGHFPKTVIIGVMPTADSSSAVLEEYDFFSLVRTSDPKIKGITIEEVQQAATQPPSKRTPRLPEGVLDIARKMLGDQALLESVGLSLGAKSNIAAATRTLSAARAFEAAKPTATTSPEHSALLKSIEESTRLDLLRTELDRLASRKQLPSVVGRPSWKPGRISTTAVLEREELGATNPIDWDETPTMYQATDIAHGHLLHYKQRWKADGYSNGDLLYSLPLAPCQTKHIVTVDWERRETATREEGTTEAEQIAATLSRDRDVSEIVNSALNEQIRGGSTAKTKSFGYGFGGGGSGKSVGAVIGVAGGSSKSSTKAWQDSSRSLAASTEQQLRDRTEQAATTVRSHRSTVVTEARQGETIGVETTAVTNHNHCHAMTMQYYEVLRHFVVQTELVDVQECVFVPLLMSPFTPDKALRWRGVLENFVLKELAPGFAALERIDNTYVNSDYPAGTYAEEPLVYLDGEMRLRMFVVRPPDPDPAKKLEELLDIDLDSTWGWFGSVFGLNAADIYRRYQRQLDARDRYYDETIIPAIARNYVENLKVSLVSTNNTRWPVDFDITMVTDYQRPSYPNSAYRGRREPTVYVRFNPDVTIRGRNIPRELISHIEIVVSAENQLPAGSRAIVESAKFRYRTDHFEGPLFSSERVLDDLVIDTARLPVFLSREERRNPRHEDAELAMRLIRHLNDNLEPYHRALWMNMDSERRYMMLDGYLAPGEAGLVKKRSLASVVENRLIGIVGNSLVFPVAPGFMLDPLLRAVTNTDEDGNELTIEERDSGKELLNLYKPPIPAPPQRFSMPTKGVFAEAILGKRVSCEEIDDTRFWRWSEEPCGDQVTPILPVDTSSRRATPESTQPSQIGTVLTLQNAPAAPAPTGLGSAIEAISKEFKDAMGIAGTQAAAQAGLQSALSTAQGFGQQAAQLAQQGGKPTPSETNQAIRQIQQQVDGGKISAKVGEELTGRALAAATGPIDPTSPEGVQNKLETIKKAVDSNAITPAQQQDLSGSALRRMVEDGQAGLVAQPQVTSLLEGARGKDVEVRDGTQYLKISSPEVPTTVDVTKLSGSQWRKIADDNGWINSTSYDDLSDTFRPKVEEFKSALEEANVKISVGGTYRHPIRAWLMHWAWEIAAGGSPPTDDPHSTGIVWDHGSADLTKSAAEQMKKAFNMDFPADPESRHISRNAIDWTLTWAGNIDIKQKDGTLVTIDTTPRHGGIKKPDGTVDEGNAKLQMVGATYGVIKFKKDPPHWSDTGG